MSARQPMTPWTSPANLVTVASMAAIFCSFEAFFFCRASALTAAAALARSRPSRSRRWNRATSVESGVLPSCCEVAVVMGPIFSPSAAVMGFFQRNVLLDMECWHVRGSLMVAPQVLRDFLEREISALPPTVCGQQQNRPQSGLVLTTLRASGVSHGGPNSQVLPLARRSRRIGDGL